MQVKILFCRIQNASGNIRAMIGGVPRKSAYGYIIAFFSLPVNSNTSVKKNEISSASLTFFIHCAILYPSRKRGRRICCKRNAAYFALSWYCLFFSLLLSSRHTNARGTNHLPTIVSGEIASATRRHTPAPYARRSRAFFVYFPCLCLPARYTRSSASLRRGLFRSAARLLGRHAHPLRGGVSSQIK